MDIAPDETPGTSAPPPASAPPQEQRDEAQQTEQRGAQQLPRNPAAGYPSEQRLHRTGRGRMLAGVAAGIADYFDVDPTIVRIGFVVLAFVGGLAVPLYLAGWLLIPEEESDRSVAEDLFARERARGAY